MESKKFQKTSFELEKDVHRELKLESHFTGVPLRKIVADLVTKYVLKNQNKLNDRINSRTTDTPYPAA